MVANKRTLCVDPWSTIFTAQMRNFKKFYPELLRALPIFGFLTFSRCLSLHFQNFCSACVTHVFGSNITHVYEYFSIKNDPHDEWNLAYYLSVNAIILWLTRHRIIYMTKICRRASLLGSPSAERACSQDGQILIAFERINRAIITLHLLWNM